jgi:hypothetical protein
VNSLTLSLIALGCIFGGTLLGMWLRSLLPEHHLSEESKDTVKLGTGMVATMAALVLGLLIASAKGTFDTMTTEIRQVGAKIILLDRVMDQYGPETKEARQLLRRTVATTLQHIFMERTNGFAPPAAGDPGNELEVVQEKLRRLSPQNDGQQWLKSRALQLSADIADAKWLLVEQFGAKSLPMPFLVLLVSWLTLIFASFGLFSPRNATVIIVLFVCAVSAAASLFLILELDQPYQGLVKISSAPLHKALMHIGR